MQPFDGRPAPAAPGDLTGHVVLPRLVEAHVHLDKTLLGSDWVPHSPAAGLLERIDGERRLLRSADVAPVEVRAAALLDLLVVNGATRVRSHVDVVDAGSLDTFAALVRLRERYRELVDLTFVAFPQRGILRTAGVPELLAEAVAMGAEAVGGLDPQEFDGDRHAHLTEVFSLAAGAGRRVDVHLHEQGPVGAATLDAIVALTHEHGLEHQVAVSHAFCLAQLPAPARDALAERLAGAGISIVTSVPGEGLTLPLGALLDRGVNVVAASDNIGDSWSPFGTADPLQRASLAAYLAGWRTDDALERALALVTANAERTLGPSPRSPAGDLTYARAASVAAAVARPPGDRTVVRGGVTVASGGRISIPVGS